MPEDLIDLACKCAINSELLQKHGSVLVCASNIFTGYNHFKYSIHSKQSKLCIPIHAEEDAINNFILYCRKKHFNDLYIRKLLNKSILIIIRVKNEQLKTSTPCFHCIKMIKHYGIKTIIYSDTSNTSNTSNTRNTRRHTNNHNKQNSTKHIKQHVSQAHTKIMLDIDDRYISKFGYYDVANKTIDERHSALHKVINYFLPIKGMHNTYKYVISALKARYILQRNTDKKIAQIFKIDNNYISNEYKENKKIIYNKSLI